MGERKVLNKYYPPDFDPAQLPKNKRPRDQQVKVRVMLPFSAQCTDCGTFIYRGTKFNARKEEALGEAYLGLKVWRFYIRCNACSNEVTFKTDPKNSDYVCENGAQRNFEQWRQNEAAEHLRKTIKQYEEEDSMKALENRTLQSKQEMDQLDALEEIRELNDRQANLNHDDVISSVIHKPKKDLLDSIVDEEEAKYEALLGEKEESVKRISEEDEASLSEKKRRLLLDSTLLPSSLNMNQLDSSATIATSTATSSSSSSSTNSGDTKAVDVKPTVMIVKKKDKSKDKEKKKKKKNDTKQKDKSSTNSENTTKPSVTSLLTNYDSDEST